MSQENICEESEESKVVSSSNNQVSDEQDITVYEDLRVLESTSSQNNCRDSDMII